MNPLCSDSSIINLRPLDSFLCAAATHFRLPFIILFVYSVLCCAPAAKFVLCERKGLVVIALLRVYSPLQNKRNSFSSHCNCVCVAAALVVPRFGRKSFSFKIVVEGLDDFIEIVL